MKKEPIILNISRLLIFLFGYTGVSKLLLYHTFHLQLVDQPLTRPYADYLAVLLPLTELFIVLLLMLPRWQKWGLYASVALMSAFTLYVGYNVFVLPLNQQPCSCGGVLKKMSWNQHMVFNTIYTLLALTAVLLNRDNHKPDHATHRQILYA